MSEPLLVLDGVTKRFARPLNTGERIASWIGAGPGPRVVRAVEQVSLTIAPHETLALVGESGCGKSTLGRVAAGIYAPDQGRVTLAGAPVMSTGRRPHKITTRVQTVFQDPFASLDPRMRVGTTIAEGPIAHNLVERADSTRYVASWLERVGLPADVATRFPHQFSGGQRQRIAIARALAMQPDLLICDEPVASLDVSIQAQVLNLLLELRRDLGLTCLFISHDLGVVRHVSDRVAIMYLGRVVELGTTAETFARPIHPYTRALLDSVPRLARDGARGREIKPIAGELPSPLAPPPGCHFNPRCVHAIDRCRSEAPELLPVAGRIAACHRAEELLATV
ncbi:MAG: ATP-binding cassette domain-containing protein [Alphaproteobacteria bacterium]|nr:ATP-binding cassette domain-containing protein [Alphaproteobacteria bacterium]